MCAPLAVLAPIIGGVAGAGAAIYSANKQAAGQKKAQQFAEEQANKNAQRAEEQSNKMNQRQPGIGAMFGANRAGAQRGVGSTFLTGAAGIPTGTLPLGGGSLLGM